MSYSTVAEFRVNIPRMSSGVIADSEVEAYIAKSDIDVNLWLLENGVDVDVIPSTPETPTIVNLMSQYGCCVYALMSEYSHMEEFPADLAFWKEKRDNLKSGKYKITVGGVDVYTPPIASIDNTHSTDLYFGYGQYGRNV